MEETRGSRDTNPQRGSVETGAVKVEFREGKASVQRSRVTTSNQVICCKLDPCGVFMGVDGVV